MSVGVFDSGNLLNRRFILNMVDDESEVLDRMIVLFNISHLLMVYQGGAKSR